MRFISICVAGFLACSGALPALAENVALVIGDRGQSRAMTDPQGVSSREIRAVLEKAGFRLIEPQERTGRTMRRATIQLSDALAADNVDRLVIFITGPFASDGVDSWALADNAVGSSVVQIGARGLSMNALTALAAQRDIPAVVLISPGVVPTDLGFGLSGEALAYVQDSRVTYATGPSPALLDLLETGLLREGLSFAEAALQAPISIALSGDLSERQGLELAGCGRVW